MKIKDCRISIFVGRDSTTIELHDRDANIQFADVTLTNDQLASALSRSAYTECECEVHGLHNVGKKREQKELVFELPKDTRFSVDSKEKACELARKSCPDGWEPVLYFNSQNSFFTKDGKEFARTIMIRWVLV